ncbi:hypothetical protein HNP84_008264 [Thermocatellispora tengchongensis]|uniref:Uncharacterized protein n=1 Tax=Thermocatellispora tengchongensis TaxID=1073253 RepID=A0A840PLL2_9ACTN|nr:hypothetical protein [Thermocatellispora tengchongensis]MBB5138510.1 hypothetical protein [Thermocatellispora tengchongensis]
MARVHQWDGFAAIEGDMRAMVADPRWAQLSGPAKAQAVAARTVVTPDGGRWLFGAHARWYRQDPADGRWHLSPPPADQNLRAAAHVVQHTAMLVPSLVPDGPDFAFEGGSTQGFVGPDVPRDITERVRAILGSRRLPSPEDFPIKGAPFTSIFAGDVPSTVAAVWGTLMWCAYAPAFDGNEVLLSMFGEFLGRALPGDEWVRWLRPVGLGDLVALYAERIRADRPKAGLRLAALMANTADAILDDDRFRPRAEALVAMLEPALRRPDLDHAAARQGDPAVRRAWLDRCPPHLARAVVPETAPGEHFAHSVYDLIEALGYLSRRRSDPRAVAVALLAADVAALAPKAAPRLYPWLDPELRHLLHATLTDRGHPLRRFWPVDGDLPPALHPPDRGTAATLLGTAYATGLAWCRLCEVAVPPHGFVTASATVSRLTHQRDDRYPLTTLESS